MAESSFRYGSGGNQLYVFNAPIITGYGRYSYSRLNPEEARELVRLCPDFVSAVGHEATALFASELLGVKVPVNRVNAQMVAGDKAIVFKLRGRLPEGIVLRTLAELYEYSEGREPFELGLLVREAEAR